MAITGQINGHLLIFAFQICFVIYTPILFCRYYFDGKGKAIRPVIAMTLAHAFNHSSGVGSDESLVWKQRRVAIISEMIHTASLLHDDVLDKADTRRGKAAVNKIFTAKKATFAGDYIIAIASKLISQVLKTLTYS